MFYKCLECGHIFEDGEEGMRENGETFWGELIVETSKCCPLCEGEYEKTIPCVICGSVHLIGELIDGRCEECIQKRG